MDTITADALSALSRICPPLEPTPAVQVAEQDTPPADGPGTIAAA